MVYLPFESHACSILQTDFQICTATKVEDHIVQPLVQKYKIKVLILLIGMGVKKVLLHVSYGVLEKQPTYLCVDKIAKVHTFGLLFRESHIGPVTLPSRMIVVMVAEP